MEMSYFGAIGNNTTGSGLKEVLELIYAENARGLCGLFKVDAVLNTLLVSETFNVPLPFQHRAYQCSDSGMH